MHVCMYASIYLFIYLFIDVCVHVLMYVRMPISSQAIYVFVLAIHKRNSFNLWLIDVDAFLYFRM